MLRHGRRRVYLSGAGSGFAISFMSFSDHVVRDLAFINAPVGDGLTVSPDERSVLFSQIDHKEAIYSWLRISNKHVRPKDRIRSGGSPIFARCSVRLNFSWNPKPLMERVLEMIATISPRKRRRVREHPGNLTGGRARYSSRHADIRVPIAVRAIQSVPQVSRSWHSRARMSDSPNAYSSA